MMGSLKHHGRTSQNVDFAPPHSQPFNSHPLPPSLSGLYCSTGTQVAERTSLPVSGSLRFTSVRAASLRASGLAARNKALKGTSSVSHSILTNRQFSEQHTAKDNGTDSKVGEDVDQPHVREDNENGLRNANKGKFCFSTLRKLSTEVSFDENKSIPDNSNTNAGGEDLLQLPISDAELAGLSYVDDDDFVSPPKRAKRIGSTSATEEESGYVLKEDVPITNRQSGLAAEVNDYKKTQKKKGSACVATRIQNGKEESDMVTRKETTVEDDFKKSAEAHADVHNKNSETSADSLSDSSSKDPEIYSYPDPDFNDFDKDRKEECFELGQIWSVYDDLDAMPRFYAQIRKVLSPGFKLEIVWLEADPNDENGIEWVSQNLPVSCGKYKYGDSEITKDRLMFSHLMYWDKGSRGGTCNIFPRKGEIWALFKNWNITWSGTTRKFEYEFVEILSEFSEGVGACVAYLAKVKGFVSLFSRTVKEGKSTSRIPPGELLRFAYRVPSFKLTGEEREGVPKGSFELDPASLPPNLEDIDAPGDVKSEAGFQLKASCFRSSDVGKPLMQTAGIASGQSTELKETHADRVDYSSSNVIENQSGHQASYPEPLEIPDSEFFNFNSAKSHEKFQNGQIWSFYSDEDGLPKYYGQIKNIESGPDFKLHVRSLSACPQKNSMIRWRDKNMPICCGRFKVKKGELEAYTSTTSFSHLLRVEPADKNDVYVILPRKGEVWALYRNWSAETKLSDLEYCKYDIVEVLEDTDMGRKVKVLERVDGFNSVFKTRLKDGVADTMEIPQLELLRFSHQIPAFQLTEETGGSLRGCLELDPSAVPVHYFS